MSNDNKYEELAQQVGALVDEKNKAYGDSFMKAGEFLKILYPTGIPPEKYIDALCIVRMFDKLMRIATKGDAFGESPYQDIMGYALLGLNNANTKEKDKAVSETWEEEPSFVPKLITNDAVPKDTVPHRPLPEGMRYTCEDLEDDC